VPETGKYLLATMPAAPVPVTPPNLRDVAASRVVCDPRWKWRDRGCLSRRQSQERQRRDSGRKTQSNHAGSPSTRINARHKHNTETR
jgi:hypothetical protein